MSRRLQHLKETYTFYIKSQGSPDTEHQILDLVEKHIKIYPKFRIKGHTKENDIKQITKKSSISKTDCGLKVTLDLHVKHYTKLYFDEHTYIPELSSRLKLPPMSIYTQILIPDNNNIDYVKITTKQPKNKISSMLC